MDLLADLIMKEARDEALKRKYCRMKVMFKLEYSDQLFAKKPIIRWNNASHYSNIKKHPHSVFVMKMIPYKALD